MPVGRGGGDPQWGSQRRVFGTLPSFSRIKRPRWRPVELNDRHQRSRGKIGDCEQSKPNLVIQWVVIFLVGSVIHLSNNQGLVVQLGPRRSSSDQPAQQSACVKTQRRQIPTILFCCFFILKYPTSWIFTAINTCPVY